MFANGVKYSIEFLKLIILVVYIFNVRVKKNINILYVISLMGVVITSYWFNISEYSVLYALIAIVIFMLVLYEKRNIKVVILSYIGISIVDMLITVICIRVFGITVENIINDYKLMSLLNSISLVFLIPISMVSKRIKRKKDYKPDTYSVLIILGGLVLSVYLTITQLFVSEMKDTSYNDIFILSAFVIVVVYGLICYLLIKNHVKNRYLKMESVMSQRLLDVQNDYYSMMLKKENETKMFRHDIRTHINCIKMLYENKEYDELGEYLDKINSHVKELSPKISTGNMYIDMIVTDLLEKYPDVVIKWKGKFPTVSVDAMDICTLFSNLMNNSFEAADKVLDKSVSVVIRTENTRLLILVSNNYEKIDMDDKNRYITTKKEDGHGYGLKNIEKCVDKYDGVYTVKTENNVFTTEIVLPNVICNM